MLTVTKRVQVGSEEYQYLLSDGSTRTSNNEFEVGETVNAKLTKISWTAKTRWVKEDDVDHDYAEIVDYGYFPSGEENGWCEIEYHITKHGKSIPVEEW